MDPRDEFVERLDLTKIRVRAFEGFVFLCGGPKENDPFPLRSVRHMLYNELTSGRHSGVAARLKLAEDIQDWFRDGNYRDLLTFEEHLGGLSAVIVLVVESAGAIAELGAFSMSDVFLERLLVLVASQHYESDSFIKLGPIKRIENFHEESVLVYDWHERPNGGRAVEAYDNMRPHMAEIVEAIKGFTAPSRAERVFRKDEPSHAMFLICELCDLFGALNQTEIGGYLEALDITLEIEVTERYLFLLNKCGLLDVKKQGHGRYYYAPEWKSRISFGFLPGGHIDKDRVRVDVASYYEREMSSRHEVLRKIGGAR